MRNYYLEIVKIVSEAASKGESVYEIAELVQLFVREYIAQEIENSAENDDLAPVYLSDEQTSGFSYGMNRAAVIAREIATYE